MIRAASLCSGIGAPEAAMPEWEWLWCAEIEKMPAQILAHRFPHSVNLGDITAEDFIERAVAVGVPDVLIAGTPCQDFSVAGLRAGLKGDRGNLTLRAVQIWEGICDAAKSMGLPPPLFWWENVPGVLSDKTNAFGALLGGLSGADSALVPGKGQRWTDSGVVDGPGRAIAWRVLDAQYFGLAQRRARVFLIADSGTRTCPAEILLEFGGMRRDFAPRREAREISTEGAEAGADECSEVAPTISARPTGGGGLGTDFDLDGGFLAAIQERAISDNPDAGPGGCGVRTDGLAYTLEARSTAQAVAFGGNNTAGICGTLNVNGKAGGSATNQDAENGLLIAHTLRGDGFDASEDGTGRGTPLIAVNEPYTLAIRGRVDGHHLEFRKDGIANAVLTPNGGRAGIGVGAIAFDCKASGQNGFGVGDIASTMRAMGHSDSHQNGGGHQAVAHDAGVRRLTPTECERLQGFPDIRKSVTIFVCSSDRQKTSALAETQNPKWLRSASNAEKGASRQNAVRAEESSSISLLGQDWPVALHVRIDFERMEVEISSLGRLLWSASNADKASWFLQSMPPADFVRLAAPMMQTLVPPTQGGRVESRPTMPHSTHPWSGSAHVPVSGQEIGVLVSDAARFTSKVSLFTKFTTSEVGQNSQNSELTLETWCCCVAAAINGFIPEQIRNASSYALSIEGRTGYTAVPYRGKPAADGPRYKGLGNSMAVNCIRWIGLRIEKALTA